MKHLHLHTHLWSKQVLREGLFLINGKEQSYSKSLLLKFVSDFETNSPSDPIVRQIGTAPGGRLIRLEYREGLGLWGYFSLTDDLAAFVEKDPTIGVHVPIDSSSDGQPIRVIVGVDPEPITGMSLWKRVEEQKMFDNQTETDTTLSAGQRQAIIAKLSRKIVSIRTENSSRDDGLLMKLVQLLSSEETASTPQEVNLSLEDRDFRKGVVSASYNSTAVSKMTKFVAAKTGCDMTGEPDARIIKTTSELCDRGTPQQRLSNWAEAMGDGTALSNDHSQEDIRSWLDAQAI